MVRNGEFWDRIARRADLTMEATPGQPLVEIYGDRRVLIENHRGVTEYKREQICVRVGFGQIVVSGSELELAHMSKDQLVICGKIAGINLCGR